MVSLFQLEKKKAMMFVIVLLLLLHRTIDLQTVLRGTIDGDFVDDRAIVAQASDGIVGIAARIWFTSWSTATGSTWNCRVN